MREWWWLSTEKMTVGVAIEEGLIVEAAPIVRRFIGQPSKNLGNWMRKQGGFRAAKLC